MNGTYVFDELAIYSGNNDLLTHVVFHSYKKVQTEKYK